MKIVIRAGGQGTRLWPMSRKTLPKQFQAIDGEKTMLRTTYERIKPLLKEGRDLFVSVNKDLAKKLQEEIPELLVENIIKETAVRNTGPAMCLEVCFLAKTCSPDEIIASLPADDYISNPKYFCKLLPSVEDFLRANPEYIITPVVQPSYLDTGYSYMKVGKTLSESGELVVCETDEVVEKPDEELCKKLIDSGQYYCHAGMYVWRLSTIIDLFKKFQPKMFEICLSAVASAKADAYYESLEKISIESAITNKTDKIAMAVFDKVGWSDLGKWHIIKKLLAPSKENLLKGDVICQKSENNLVYNTVEGKLVVINGLNDLVVVDTDDVLFVSSLENSAEVKKIVEKLTEEGKHKYL